MAAGSRGSLSSLSPINSAFIPVTMAIIMVGISFIEKMWFSQLMRRVAVYTEFSLFSCSSTSGRRVSYTTLSTISRAKSCHGKFESVSRNCFQDLSDDHDYWHWKSVLTHVRAVKQHHKARETLLSNF